MTGKIRIDPDAVAIGAEGLAKYVAPELAAQAEKLLDNYRIAAPGFGLLGSPVEAYYNSVAAYHQENLAAGVQVTQKISQGLHQTITNYNSAEKVNVDMFTVGGGASPGFVESAGNAGIARSVKDASHVLEQISRYSSNETLTFELELAAVGVAGLCAALCLSFTPVVVIFGTLVANIPSMVMLPGRCMILPRFWIRRPSRASTNSPRMRPLVGMIAVVLTMMLL